MTPSENMSTLLPYSFSPSTYFSTSGATNPGVPHRLNKIRSSSPSIIANPKSAIIISQGVETFFTRILSGFKLFILNFIFFINILIFC